MIKFEFKDGERVIDLDADPESRICKRILATMSKPIASLKCPVHSDDSQAVISVDLGQDTVVWEITDSCCDTFSDIIDSEMPYPWTSTPHHLQP